MGKDKQKTSKDSSISLIRQLILFLFKSFIKCENYYIYDNKLDELVNTSCKVGNLTITSVFLPITLSEYEELGRKGFNFTTHPDARDYKGFSDKGTIIFWTTVNGELVNQTGITTVRNGSVYEDIYKFCPSSIEDEYIVYEGLSETAVKYRQKGVYTWVHAEIFRYLKDKGFSRVIFLIFLEAIGAWKGQKKLGSKVLCEVCLLTFLPILRSKFRFHIWVTSKRWLTLLGRLLSE